MKVGDLLEGDEWLTIGEAAARFGVPARSLRRAIERCQNAARERGANEANGARNSVTTRQVTRHTRTGERTAAAFPVAFLEHLAVEIQAVPQGEGQSPHPNGNGAQTRQGTQSEPGTNGAENAANEDSAPRSAPLDARAQNVVTLALLEAENERLRADLERERIGRQQEVTRLSSALEREQVLTLEALRVASHTQSELQTLRDRAALLEGQNAHLIEALPVASSDGHTPPHEAAQSATTNETADDGTQQPQAAPRPWWQFWKEQDRK